MSINKTIIISDLDGTLLHPQTYSFKEARPALQLIRECRIPLILCSSKTRSEIEVYRKRLKNSDPFISENGGGIFIPKKYFPFAAGQSVDQNYRSITLGESYEKIRRQFILIRNESGIKVKGFGDMTIKEISRLTNMTMRASALARKRDFEEPFIFLSTQHKRFLQAIDERGLHWTAGRFFHIMGCHDKGKAVDILISFYQRYWDSVITIGLGDGLNDLPMLQRVDWPVLIRHTDDSYDQRVKFPGIIKTRQVAGAGWNEAVLSLLGHLSRRSNRPV
jgi:mannosyl-3-phosphoglycerate phosphatase family protein